jgi:hypothetical protein
VTRDELEHVIRAACDIAKDDEVFIFGSQAILGQYPDAPEPLRMSAEADIWPKNRDDLGEALNSIGEDSTFHHRFGYYVHGVPITEAAKLPANWAMRTIHIRNANTDDKTAYCLEAHDLAASKLAAFREKDRDFVRVLLAEKLITPRKLIARVRRLPVDEKMRERLVLWVDRTVRELNAP